MKTRICKIFLIILTLLAGCSAPVKKRPFVIKTQNYPHPHIRAYLMWAVEQDRKENPTRNYKRRTK